MFQVMRDYNADAKIDWHDYYLEALTPVQNVSIKLGDLLFTPISALLHTIWFVAWFSLGLDINLLTLIVSLEAIYITLFIGLGQKLADKRGIKLATRYYPTFDDAAQAVARGEAAAMVSNYVDLEAYL